jgi:hypothetical protein
MKTYIYLVLFFSLINGCIRFCDHIEAEEHKAMVASGTTTWLFKTPSGDTITSTQYNSWGQPDYGNIGPNGCSPRYPQRWYYGRCTHWVAVTDDKFRIWINPNCTLIGKK